MILRRLPVASNARTYTQCNLMVFVLKYPYFAKAAEILCKFPFFPAFLLQLLITAAFPGMVMATPESFQEAKRLAERVHSVHAEEFYCGCRIHWSAGKETIDLANCGYLVRKNGPRANRLEWEHVVPAADFGRQRPCWKQGGRKHCEATDPVFNRMEGDLFNLQPAIGEVNGDRSNFQFGEISGSSTQYGACQMKIDFDQRLVEPRGAIKGDIARTYFYMSHQYGLRLSKQQQQLFVAWNAQDPVDAWELERNQQIAQHMGHNNDFVTGKLKWVLDGTPMAVTTSATTAQLNMLPVAQAVTRTFVRGNKKSRVYHRPDCPSYGAIAEKNREEFPDVQSAEKAGYRLAGNCP